MIERNILGQKLIRDGDEDFRYSISVLLIRDKRPKYWSFHCPKCGAKLVELDGEVAYMADVALPNPVMRARCNSRDCGGRIWWEFSLS